MKWVAILAAVVAAPFALAAAWWGIVVGYLRRVHRRGGRTYPPH